MQNKKTLRSLPCGISASLLGHGLFAVLCQLAYILLSLDLQPREVSLSVMRHTYLPYLEYPLASVALIFGGALLIDYIILKDRG